MPVMVPLCLPALPPLLPCLAAKRTVQHYLPNCPSSVSNPRAPLSRVAPPSLTNAGALHMKPYRAGPVATLPSNPMAPRNCKPAVTAASCVITSAVMCACSPAITTVLPCCALTFPSVLPHHSKQPQQLKQAHDDLHHDEPDDNPLQAHVVVVVLVVAQHVEHLLQH